MTTTPESSEYSEYPEVNHAIGLFREGIDRAILMLDIDQTIFSCFDKHLEVGLERLREFHPDLVVTNEDRQKAFDTGNVFAIFGEWEEYLEINSQIRLDPVFHTNMPLLDENIPRVLEEFEAEGIRTGLYITARPREIVELTTEELKKAGCLREALVLAYSESKKDEVVYDWKVDRIFEVARALAKKGGKVVFVDDNLKQIQILVERMAQEKVVNIIPILMDCWGHSEERMQYTLADWRNIQDVLSAISFNM